MNLKDRITLFSSLGEQINLDSEIYFGDDFNDARIKNPWFTKSNIDIAISSIKECLSFDNIHSLLSNYDIPSIDAKRVLVIMAGNIPLVGFHDFLCALICNHKITIKQSSNDKHLLPFIVHYLVKLAPEFKNKIVFLDQKLEGFDAAGRPLTSYDLIQRDKGDILIDIFESEINRYGLFGFFYNSSGEYSHEVLQAFINIKAETSVEIIDSAIRVLKSLPVSKDILLRRQQISKLKQEELDIWSALEFRLIESKEDIVKLLINYIALHKTDFEY